MIDKEKLLNSLDREISALNHMILQDRKNYKKYNYAVSLIKHIKNKIGDGEFDRK